jgi:hypothetical protein
MNYEKYFYELVEMSKLMGVQVETRESSEFTRSTYGEFNDGTITLFYEKEFVIDKETLFTLAHEFRHAYQKLTGFRKEYWYFVDGLGDKPPAEIKDEIEADADEWAVAYFKGRGIRIPKHLLGDAS